MVSIREARVTHVVHALYIYITVCREEGNPEQTKINDSKTNRSVTTFLSFFPSHLFVCFSLLDFSSRRTNMARLLLSDRDQVSIDQIVVVRAKNREIARKPNLRTVSE